ncbi:MAG: DUF58 domain-containing protein [bacterium]|nr:DUF58 domain-containing protein [bacterium]
MNRLSYRLLKGYSSLIYWLKIRINPAGGVMLVSLAFSAMLGMNTNMTMAYQAFAFILALLLISLVSLPFFRGSFSVKRELPLMASVGIPFSYRIKLRSGSRRVRKGLAVMEELADPRPSSELFEEKLSTIPARSLIKTVIFGRGYFSYWNRLVSSAKMAEQGRVNMDAIPAKGKAEAVMELTPLRRGYIRFTGFSITRSDPFGLFRSVIREEEGDALLVLPKRYPVPGISLEGRRRHHQGGISLASRVGNADEFVGLRDYRPGDPLRTIHWKSWAKSGRPVVKEYEDEFFSRHALILDSFADAAGGELFEEAVSVAASFASKITMGESLLDLIFVEGEATCFTMGRSLGSPKMMLEILACAVPCKGKSFDALGSFVLSRAGMMSSAICILIKWDDERRELVKRLKALHIPLILFLIVPEDAPIKDIDPGPMRDAPGRFHTLPLGKVEEALANI